MRILHIDTGPTLRGGQHQLLHLVRHCPVESTVMAPAGSPTLAAARELGLPVLPLSPGPLLAANYDLIHCHDAKSHTLAAVFSRRPFVVSRRVIFDVKRGLASRLKYSRPARYLAISNAVLCKLLAAGIPESRIDIVPDGVELPADVSTRTGPAIALQSDDPAKGNELLRKAHIPVHFTRDLPGLLPQASAFLYITDTEGLGSAALLAMAHGVPVIASRVGGLPEIVIDGRTGLLTRNQPSEISAALHRLQTEPGLADALAAAGRSLVERRYTVQHLAQNTFKVYEKVLA